MTKIKTDLAPADEGFSLISNRKLLTLYAAMVQCRRIAGSAENQRRRQAPGGLLGHEATAVGAAIDLRPHDTVAAAHWPIGAIRAINPFVSIAASVSHAARSARASQDGRKVTLLFSIGKPGASWLKALTLAADQNLSILFVSLTSRVAVSDSLGGGTIPTKRRGYAFPLISVDGNDVVAVFRVASEAIAHARKGNGPTLIDSRITTPGDPLLNMEKYLSAKGLSLE
jgi:pyruvate dehydrogenase E1 component alpha subunit